MQKPSISSWLLSGLFIASSCAFAAPTENQNNLSSNFQRCNQNAQGIIEQAACLSTEADNQDARLKSVYNQLQTQLTTAQQTQLIASQRLWEEVKTADATFESALYDNSQPDNLQMKLNDIYRVKARADQLTQYLQLLR